MNCYPFLLSAAQRSTSPRSSNMGFISILPALSLDRHSLISTSKDCPASNNGVREGSSAFPDLVVKPLLCSKGLTSHPISLSRFKAAFCSRCRLHLRGAASQYTGPRPSVDPFPVSLRRESRQVRDVSRVPITRRLEG